MRLFKLTLPNLAPVYSRQQLSSGTQPQALALNFACLVVCAGYLLSGIVGHQPWKQDETYIFGIIQHMVESADWVVPTMAGEAFMEKPPLYYWLASGLVILFGDFMRWHDAARLANPIFMSITCLALYRAAQLTWGNHAGRVSVLALLSCLGLLLHSHLMITDVPMLTGFAIALLGLLAYQSQQKWAAACLGLGVGLAFLAKGLLACAVFGLSALILPCLFANWRRRDYAVFLLQAAAYSLPLLLIWPLCLYLRDTDLFMEWFWQNNVGRYLGFAVAKLGAEHKPGFWLAALPWFSFPVLPLLLIYAGKRGRQIWQDTGWQIASVVFAVMLVLLQTAASARDNYALPLLAPLALAAGPILPVLPKRLLALGDWFSRCLFSSIAVIIVLVWLCMWLQGTAPDWPWLTRHLPADYALQFKLADVLVASTATLAAFLIWSHAPRWPERFLLSWLTGLSLCWCLLTSLWLDWIDYAKSYQAVYTQIQQKLPRDFHCIASYNLGESERAMLRYYTGIISTRLENQPKSDCELVLIGSYIDQALSHYQAADWELLWQGARPGDQRERLRLFQRDNAAALAENFPHELKMETLPD